MTRFLWGKHYRYLITLKTERLTHNLVARASRTSFRAPTSTWPLMLPPTPPEPTSLLTAATPPLKFRTGKIHRFTVHMSHIV